MSLFALCLRFPSTPASELKGEEAGENGDRMPGLVRKGSGWKSAAGKEDGMQDSRDP